MDIQRLKDLEETLYKSMWFFESERKRNAIEKIAHDKSPIAIQILVRTIITCKDSYVYQLAYNTLRNLKDKKSIDEICSIWMENRNFKIEKLLLECSWVASVPSKMQILTALKVGKPNLIEMLPCLVEPLINACKDSDAIISQNAQNYIKSLKDSEIIDALCVLWMQKRDSFLNEIIIHSGYIARKPIYTRILNILQTQQLEILSYAGADIVPLLIQAYQDNDVNIVILNQLCQLYAYNFNFGKSNFVV